MIWNYLNGIVFQGCICHYHQDHVLSSVLLNLVVLYVEILEETHEVNGFNESFSV